MYRLSSEVLKEINEILVTGVRAGIKRRILRSSADDLTSSISFDLGEGGEESEDVLAIQLSVMRKLVSKGWFAEDTYSRGVIATKKFMVSTVSGDTNEEKITLRLVIEKNSYPIISASLWQYDGH